MNTASTADLSDRAVITYIQTVNKKIRGQNFNHRRHKDWKWAGLMEQDENNHKNEFNRRTKIYKGVKHINKLNEGPYNVDFK